MIALKELTQPTCAFVVLLAAAVCTASAAERSATLKDLCITNGQVSEPNQAQLQVDSASSRFFAKSMDDAHAAIRFEYLGPTEETSLFASGTMKRQLGVKLKNPDSCNGIYVMWRIEPESDIQVQLKRNVDKATMKECGVKGYKVIEPKFTKPVAPIEVGRPRTLAASLDNGLLVVKVDDEVVWKGDTGPASRSVSGHAGFRSDNARVKFAYIGHETELSQADARTTSKARVACH